MSSDVQHTQDGFRLRNIFGHLNRTWEALRMEGADSPIRNNLNRLYKELSATAEHLLKDCTDLATFGRKCAELAAGLQWVIVHHFVPLNFWRSSRTLRRNSASATFIWRTA
jgi:hypothetical protein